MKLYEAVLFNNFYKVIATKNLPFKVAYKLAKLSKFAAENTEFYQNELNKLIADFGAKDEDGNFLISDGQNIKIIPEKETECLEKLHELDEIEVDAPDIKFSLNELEDLDISAADLQALMPFIEEE